MAVWQNVMILINSQAENSPDISKPSAAAPQSSLQLLGFLYKHLALIMFGINWPRE